MLKINFIMESEIQEFIGNEKLEKAIIKNMRTGEISTKEIDGAFILIGYDPNTESLKGIIELNNKNEIITNDLMETNISGVFAAGDSRAKRYRQITTSVSDGTIAALSAADYIEKQKEEILV